MSNFLDSIKKMKEEAAAKEAQAKAREEQLKNGGSFQKKEIPEYADCNEEGAVVRILSFDKIFASTIACDDGKPKNFIHPTITNQFGVKVVDPQSLLYRLHRKVMEVKTWENGKPKDFMYEGTAIHRRVSENIPVVNGKRYDFGKPFSPQERALLQVIYRNDSFCEVNKHSKVLTSKKNIFSFTNEKKEQIQIDYSDVGITKSQFDKFKEIMEMKGEEFIAKTDLIFAKVEKKSSASSRGKIEYETYHCKNEDAQAKFPIINKVAKFGDLTPEEEQYELYDLEKIFVPYTVFTLNKHLRGLFELCDKELGTNFIKEIDEEIKLKKTQTTTNVPKDQTTLSSLDYKVELSLEEKTQKYLPKFYDKIKTKEGDWKEFFNSIEDVMPDGTIIWKKETKLIKCERTCENSTQQNNRLYTCTKCAKDFE